MRHRTLLRGPELEPRLGACAAQGVCELGALFDERLVDDDEHALAILDASGFDEVAAPARVHDGLGRHSAMVATRAPHDPWPIHSSPPT